MEIAPPPKLWKMPPPPTRKWKCCIFPSNCAITQVSFLTFFPFIIMYICCCCVFWPLENVSILCVISPKISKIKLSGDEIFEIFRQIAPVTQASFLTCFAMCIFVLFFYPRKTPALLTHFDRKFQKLNFLGVKILIFSVKLRL